MEQLIDHVRGASRAIASMTAGVPADQVLLAAVLAVGGVAGRITVGRDGLPRPERVDRWPLAAAGGASVVVGSLLVVAETFSAVGSETGLLGAVLVLVGFGAVGARIAVEEERPRRGTGYALVGVGFAGVFVDVAPSVALSVAAVGGLLYFTDDSTVES
ncbi:QVPTGV class sortase B protein-sorting domain-containing protein [Halostella sp. JP-L12]|uniref:QVPTGV class sortase B protein-sorting domain-containing protein n=1 Tax=Halostella TaxID=1843185 RepID=UPI000EF7A395|nr:MULTISPECIES: QVPTGV class sortase B protein-sorting domain-containing protein [Halostella]NHN46996.1 QVPTGV class sortase B protein-sorting domain-containing protein [Halostella sp. JP-L12]